jgi:hypothetical protein
MLLGLGAARGAPLAAQATNPPYLAQFPTVAKVKQAMRAKDPRETALMQMGALWQLQEIIKQLSGHREFRGLLSDEAKVVQDYYAAHYYVGKAIDSLYPGPYGDWQHVSDNTPYRYMRTDARFGIEGIETYALLPPAVVDAFLQSVGVDKARWAARARADSLAMIAARNAPQAGSGPPGLRTDPETMQIRRCIESGRSEMQCMMEGLGKSAMGMVGAILPGLAALKSAPIQGIRMSGVYPGDNKFALTFSNDGVMLNCADLVLISTSYTTAVGAEGIRITVESSPKPMALTLRADGRLAGPGPTDINGQIITGYQPGVRTWSDGHTEPISRPIYANATRRCNVALLTASGPTSPLMGSPSTMAATALNMVFGSPDADAGKPAPVGARMSGEYGSQAALDLEFKPEGVVLGCREVASLRSYTVQAQGGKAAIRIANGATPLDFLFGADGRISGTGSVRVDGRVVSGSAPDGGIAYAPRSATCSIGALAPAAEQLSEAEQGAAAARASLGQPPVSAGALAVSAPAETGSGVGAAIVQIESGFPKDASGASPLGGMTVLLLDVGLDAVLREADVVTPPGKGFKAAFDETNAAGGEKRAKLLRVLGAHTQSSFQLDKDGIGKSPELTVGKTNGFLASATVGGTKYVWALAGVAKAGWTKVVLTGGNALR